MYRTQIQHLWSIILCANLDYSHCFSHKLRIMLMSTTLQVAHEEITLQLKHMCIYTLILTCNIRKSMMLIYIATQCITMNIIVWLNEAMDALLWLYSINGCLMCHVHMLLQQQLLSNQYHRLTLMNGSIKD